MIDQLSSFADEVTSRDWMLRQPGRCLSPSDEVVVDVLLTDLPAQRSGELAAVLQVPNYAQRRSFLIPADPRITTADRTAFATGAG